MYKNPTIAQCKYFHDEFCTLLLSFGANKIDYRPRTKGNLGLCEETTFELETKVGKLRVSVADDSLYCKFEDVPRAKELLWRDSISRLNPYSGKWNWHFGRHETKEEINNMVLSFDCEIEKLLLN